MEGTGGSWTHTCTPHCSGVHPQETWVWLVPWGEPPEPTCVKQFWECIWPLQKCLWFLLVQEAILMVQLTTDSISILLIFTQFQSACFKEMDVNSTSSTSYLLPKCFGGKYTVFSQCVFSCFSAELEPQLSNQCHSRATRGIPILSALPRVTHAFIVHRRNYLGNWNSSITFYQVVQTSLKSIHFSHYQNMPSRMSCQSRHKSCSGAPQPDTPAASETTLHVTTKEHQKLQR